MALSRKRARKVRAAMEYALLVDGFVALCLAVSSHSTLAAILAAGLILQWFAHIALKPAVGRTRGKARR